MNSDTSHNYLLTNLHYVLELHGTHAHSE